MPDPSFSEIGALMKKKPVRLQKAGSAPDAEQWLDDFTLWLEESYHNLVPHPRDETVLHCSSLYQVCARKEWLFRMLKPGPEKLVAGQTLTFDIGHAMHWWWQHRYLGPRQELFGDWFCAGCKTTKRGLMPMKCECGLDWRVGINYVELEVKDEKLGYIGHTDGILVDRLSGIRRVFEFKSISDSEYKKLKKPKFAHVIQSHAYMHSLGLTESLIIYANKGIQCEWGHSDGSVKAGKINVKVYVVKFDNGLWTEMEKRIKDRKGALEELNLLLKNDGKITEERISTCPRICQSKDDDAAKYCPVRDQCFRMRAPGDEPRPQGEFSISL